jgi:hypothetical protein
MNNVAPERNPADSSGEKGFTGGFLPGGFVMCPADLGEGVVAMPTATTAPVSSRSKSTILFAWLLVAAPLVFGIAAAIADQNFPMSGGLTVAMVIALFVTLGILVDFDSIRLKRAGFMPPAMGWFLLPPVYLWQRANRTNGPKMMCAMFCASLIAGVAIRSPAVTRGCFSGLGLPACDSSIAAYEVRRLIDQADGSFGITALQLHDVLQTAFDGTTRSCWGKVYRSNGTDHSYRYDFRIDNRRLVTTVKYEAW